MPSLVKTFFSLVAIAAIAFFAVIQPASSHETRPGIVDLTIQPDGKIEARYRFNFQEIIDQFADKKEVGKIVGGDLNASARSDTELAALTDLFAGVKDDFVNGISIRADGRKIKLELQEVIIPARVQPGEARIGIAILSATLPGGVKALTWQNEKKLSNVVLRVKGGSKKTGNDAAAGEGSGQKSFVFAGVVKAGEVSKPIDVENLVTVSRLDVFLQYVGLGIEHIVPKGLDHILFVVGLFLLSTRLSSLLWQISAFTLAHTITLGLAMGGFVTVPAAIVEPLIAASIVYVAVENIMTSKLHRWRPVIVFLFGLLHGLGFAGVLLEIGLAPANFLVGLIGFNIGVELGQLTVIAACFLLVGLWFRDKPWYRSRITTPASVVIAVIASWWFIERTFL